MPAILRRLAVFDTQSLEKPVTRANELLRTHCMQVFHYLADQLQNEPLFSDDEDEIEEDDTFGNGAIYSELSQTKSTLIDEMDIESVDLKSTPANTSTDVTFEPLANVTKEDMAGAIALAARLEPETYQIDHKLQITSGATDDPEYLKAVMLLISCDLRIINLTRLQELNVQRMYQEQYNLPNSVLDAWMVLEGKCRPQFKISKLLETYPGLKKNIPIELHTELERTIDEDNLQDDSVENDEHVDDEDHNEEIGEATNSHNDSDEESSAESSAESEEEERIGKDGSDSCTEDDEVKQDQQRLQIKWPFRNLRSWFHR